MKATVKVSHMSTGDKDYRRGDVVDLSDEETVTLAPFVERIVPTVAVIDDRDAKIVELEAIIETIGDANDAKDAEITKLKKEISSRQREIQKLLKEK